MGIRTDKLIWSFLVLLAGLAIVACQGPAGKNGKDGNSPAPVSGVGTMTGSGTFDDGNAQVFLEKTQEYLIGLFEYIHEDIFDGLPEGFNKSQMVEMIKNIRYSPTKSKTQTVPREMCFETDVIEDKSTESCTRGLMFDFGTDENGPYIEALDRFYMRYETVLVRLNRDYRAEMIELSRIIFHEIAHHIKDIGEDDKKAEAFAVALLQSIFSQHVYCYWDKGFDVNQEPFMGEPTADGLDYVFYDNYATGDHISINTIPPYQTGWSQFDVVMILDYPVSYRLDGASYHDSHVTNSVLETDSTGMRQIPKIAEMHAKKASFAGLKGKDFDVFFSDSHLDFEELQLKVNHYPDAKRFDLWFSEILPQEDGIHLKLKFNEWFSPSINLANSTGFTLPNKSRRWQIEAFTSLIIDEDLDGRVEADFPGGTISAGFPFRTTRGKQDGLEIPAITKSFPVQCSKGHYKVNTHRNFVLHKLLESNYFTEGRNRFSQPKGN